MSQDQDRSADDLAREQPLLRGSECLDCKDHRTIISGRGSIFLLCQSERVPASWPKYPRQPMQGCPYFCKSCTEQDASDPPDHSPKAN
ncbi:MAG: hypothetical protein ACK6AT_05910 [Planctomycetota bacterium]